MEKFNEKIKNDLDGKPVFDQNEAYKMLKKFTGNDDSRNYLHGVYFENGIACATNAHVLACVNTSSELNGVLVNTGIDMHKTDIVEIKDDGKIEVSCGHKNDKSGIYDPVDCEFREISQVYPDNSISNSKNPNYKFDVNAEYLTMLAGTLTDKNYDKRRRISIAPFIGQNGICPDFPIKIDAKLGIGIIMPLRID